MHVLTQADAVANANESTPPERVAHAILTLVALLVPKAQTLTQMHAVADESTPRSAWRALKRLLLIT
jgi:hypothetical protein